jgi:glycosyltransferase involved in cell wall biosynthesis
VSSPALVNLLWCVPGQVGGSEEYLTRILAGLADDPHGFDLTVAAPHGLAEAHPGIGAALRWRVGPVDGSSRPRRVLAERTWLPRLVRELRPRLVHHAGGTAPRTAAPVVLTIHDLQYLTYPEHFSQQKLAWLKAVVPRSARHAAVVSVPSEYVRGTVVDAFGIDAERVVVVPHGIEVGHRADSGTPEHLVRSRYGLPGPFVVFPAITHPHKDHLTLLRAVARLVPEEPELRVVLLGGSGAAASAVSDEIEALGLEVAVVRPGRVPAADRDGLIAHATVLAFPSRYEGFGAPVLEAMALGTPVIAADATALPEVLAGAGVLVPPGDVDAWAGSLHRLLHDEGERRELARRGRARAAELSLVRSAAAQAHAYRLALA